MRVVERQHIEAQHGTALLLQQGDVLRVIDPRGEQVSDVIAFRADDTAECLSSGRSIDYNDTIRFTSGHVLYSNRSAPMLTIGEDRVGLHDFLLTPCSQEMFARLYAVQGHHPSCFENLASALEPWGILPDRIPTTLNLFMNVAVGGDGRVVIGTPPSRAGDFVDLRAEMDLIVGITACSAEKSNNGTLKPIDLEVRSHQDEPVQ